MDPACIVLSNKDILGLILPQASVTLRSVNKQWKTLIPDEIAVCKGCGRDPNICSQEDPIGHRTYYFRVREKICTCLNMGCSFIIGHKGPCNGPCNGPRNGPVIGPTGPMGYTGY